MNRPRTALLSSTNVLAYIAGRPRLSFYLAGLDPARLWLGSTQLGSTLIGLTLTSLFCLIEHSPTRLSSALGSALSGSHSTTILHLTIFNTLYKYPIFNINYKYSVNYIRCFIWQHLILNINTKYFIWHYPILRTNIQSYKQRSQYQYSLTILVVLPYMSIMLERPRKICNVFYR